MVASPSDNDDSVTNQQVSGTPGAAILTTMSTKSTAVINHKQGLTSATSDKSTRVEERGQPVTRTRSPTRVRQLFVGNLPYRIRWQDLKDLFRTTGQVIRADLAMSPDHRSKGYGTVLMATVEDAQVAIDMLHNTKWHGRTLKVREDRGHVEQPNQKKSVMVEPMEQHQGSKHEIDMKKVIPPCRQLFVGNLPFHCQWQDIKDLFRGAGKIIRADVAQEPSGKSRGFGIVLFATFEDAKKAIDMFDGFEYYGRQLRVHYDKYVSGLPQQQSMSIFENVEFTQIPDPAVIESLNQTYGNTHSLGKSAYIPNPSDVVYSPTIDTNNDKVQTVNYLEPLNPLTTFSSQQLAQYEYDRSTYNMPYVPYQEYYPSSTAMIYSHQSDLKGTYDHQRILHQHSNPSFDTTDGYTDSSAYALMYQNQSTTYQWAPPTQEKHQVPYSQATVAPSQQSYLYSSSAYQPSTFYEPYPLYLQRPHIDWQQNDNGTHDSLLDGMQNMGLSENESAGLPNLDVSGSNKQQQLWN